ncbi:MAG: phosphotransferase [Pseudomonadota bacterium]
MSVANTPHSGAGDSARSAPEAQVAAWLRSHCGLDVTALEPASEDASFRRYLRASLADGSTRIVMDAPPEHEDSRPFVAIAVLLARAGLHVPRIYALDLTRGWLLLEDLGSTPYLDALARKPAAADRLYSNAIAALVTMQARAERPAAVVPPFDAALLGRELDLFPDWFCHRLLQRPLAAAERSAWRRERQWLIEMSLAAPQTLVHRDYHSRNLMVVGGDSCPGIIDFQDAVIGPVSYDLMSLLKDCYIVLDDGARRHYLNDYLERAAAAGVETGGREIFVDAFRRTGLQRHLKVAGIFSRLNFRDGKERYLRDLPVVLRYLRDALAEETEPLPFLTEFLGGCELPAACYR